MEGAATLYTLSFKLANGVNTVGAFPIYSGATLGMPYWMDTDPSGMGADGYYNFLAGRAINYLDEQLSTPPPAVTLSFNYAQYKKRLEQVTAEFDTTNADMDQFVKNGGKLIMVQGDADMLVPPTLTNAFNNSIAERYGVETKQFSRYYTVPGFGDGFGTYDFAWDSLTRSTHGSARAPRPGTGWLQRKHRRSSPAALSVPHLAEVPRPRRHQRRVQLPVCNRLGATGHCRMAFRPLVEHSRTGGPRGAGTRREAPA